ncbi:MAG: hypothetical protein ACRCXW_11230, partial [Plesiomonas shigelloides]
MATSLWAAFLGNKAHFFRLCDCQSCNRLVAGFFVPAWFALRAFLLGGSHVGIKPRYLDDCRDMAVTAQIRH